MAENTTHINLIKQKFAGISFPERLDNSGYIPGWFLGVQTDDDVKKEIKKDDTKTNFFIYECNNIECGALPPIPNPISISKMCLYFREEFPAREPICFSIDSLFTESYFYPHFDSTYNSLVDFYKDELLSVIFSQNLNSNNFNLHTVSGLAEEFKYMTLECEIPNSAAAAGSGIKKHSKGKRTNKGKGKRTNKGKGKKNNKGKGKSRN